MSNESAWPPLWCLCEPGPQMIKPVQKCPACKGLRVKSGLPRRVGESTVSNGVAVTRLSNGVRLSTGRR